jgi:hypothetical protein
VKDLIGTDSRVARPLRRHMVVRSDLANRPAGQGAGNPGRRRKPWRTADRVGPSAPLKSPLASAAVAITTATRTSRHGYERR